MSLKVITLQPDWRGHINTPLSEADRAVEFRCKALPPSKEGTGGVGGAYEEDTGGTPTGVTQDSVESAGQAPIRAQEFVVSPHTTEPKANDPTREGPILLPFVRHLCGQHRGGFSGDSSLLVALGDAKEVLAPGTIVNLKGYEPTHGVTLIERATSSSVTAVYGVVRGSIENEDKRKYRDASAGATEYLPGTLYAVQLFGTCMAKIKDAGTLTAGTKLYIDLGDPESGLVTTGGTFYAYFFGGKIPYASYLKVPEAYTAGWIYVPIGTGSGADYSHFCFGFTISGAAVTIKSGEVQWGTVTHVVADTTVTITQDRQYVGVQAAASGATILGPSTNPSIFRSDASAYRKWLYCFRFNKGSASLDRIGLTNIEITGLGALP